MKRSIVAASLSQAAPALIGSSIPALYLMTAGFTGPASLANAATLAAVLKVGLVDWLLAAAALLAVAG